MCFDKILTPQSYKIVIISSFVTVIGANGCRIYGRNKGINTTVS